MRVQFVDDRSGELLLGMYTDKTAVLPSVGMELEMHGIYDTDDAEKLQGRAHQVYLLGAVVKIKIRYGVDHWDNAAVFQSRITNGSCIFVVYLAIEKAQCFLPAATEASALDQGRSEVEAIATA